MNTQIAGQGAGAPRPDVIMQFFDYAHLPPILRAVSHVFYDMAHWIVAECPASAERTVALRKLLESKDAAVRSVVQRLNEEKARAIEEEERQRAIEKQVAAQLQEADRKSGINDLPADQQRQLEEGKPIAPQPDPGSQRPAETSDAAPVRDFILIGSDAFDSLIDIGGKPVQLGEIVSGAHAASGLSATYWNGLAQEDRDTWIRGHIDVLRMAAAGATPDSTTADAPAQGEPACSEGAARPADNDGGRGSAADTATVTSGPQA